MTVSESATICNKLGLHARSATAFVKAASKFGCGVTVTSDHASANGKSIMSMLMLQASKGMQIHIEADGQDEADALAALIQLVNDGFGED